MGQGDKHKVVIPKGICCLLCGKQATLERQQALWRHISYLKKNPDARYDHNIPSVEEVQDWHCEACDRFISASLEIFWNQQDHQKGEPSTDEQVEFWNKIYRGEDPYGLKAEQRDVGKEINLD